MNLIAEIDDSTIGLDTSESVPVTKDRYAVRAVVVDDNDRICLVWAKNAGYYKLPGGGVDEGETNEAALIREVAEETGYQCEIVAELGRIVEYRCQDPKYLRSGLKQISDCYVARVIRHVGSNLMDDELGDGFEPLWVDSANKAIELLKKVEFGATPYTTRYSIMFFEERERCILEEYARQQGGGNG